MSKTEAEDDVNGEKLRPFKQFEGPWRLECGQGTLSNMMEYIKPCECLQKLFVFNPKKVKLVVEGLQTRYLFVKFHVYFQHSWRQRSTDIWAAGRNWLGGEPSRGQGSIGIKRCPQRIVSGRGEDHDSSLRSRCDFIENEADCSERQLCYSS